MDIEWIRQKIKSREYLWTLHADEERRHDNLERADIENGLRDGCILEDYPEDRRGPSCLILATTSQGIPIHIVCGRNSIDQLVIVTVYIPSPPKWRTSKERRLA